MSDFFCSGCGNTYQTNTTDEEKENEFIERYGHKIADSDEEVLSLCDYCYEKLQASKLSDT